MGSSLGSDVKVNPGRGSSGAVASILKNNMIEMFSYVKENR